MATYSSTLAWKIPWMVDPHGVAKSRTRLSDFTFTFHFHALEKEMTTHSSVHTVLHSGCTSLHPHQQCKSPTQGSNPGLLL